MLKNKIMQKPRFILEIISFKEPKKILKITTFKELALWLEIAFEDTTLKALVFIDQTSNAKGVLNLQEAREDGGFTLKGYKELKATMK